MDSDSTPEAIMVFFVSEDGGNSWFPTSFNDPVSTLTVNRDTIYVGTWGQGVFRSDDAGLTWKSIRNGLRFHEFEDGTRHYGEVHRILITDNNIINVMYHNGTYTSTDRGETWHDISKEWLVGNSIYSMTEFDGLSLECNIDRFYAAFTRQWQDMGNGPLF